MAIDGIPKEMTAVQVVEFGKPYVIQQVPTPQDLKEYEVLLKTGVASLCHTDGMVVAGKFPTKLPCTASHEGTGTVVAVGSKVTNFKKGDRVMSGLPKNPCGSCEDCKGPDDWHQYCVNIEGHLGVMVNGAFADYHVVDSRNSCHVPDAVSLAAAAPLACAGCTIYRSLLITEAPKDGWIAIVGAGGGLGHLGIQMGKAMGYNIVAVDARDEGLELCKKAGAGHIFDARTDTKKMVEAIKALTPDKLGVHSAINVSEHKTAAATACAITKMHGNMIQVAQPDEVCIPFQELIFRDIRVKGTLIAGQEASQDMLNLVAEHGIEVETNLFYGLREVPEMVELSHSGKMKGKAVCVVDKSQI